MLINKECRELLGSSSAARKMLLYGGAGGVTYSLMQFGDVIARKSLHATGLQITILTIASPLVYIASLWWGKILTGRDQSKILWMAGSVGLLFMASGFFLTNFGHLLALTLVFYIADSLMLAAQNRVLQNYIPAQKTGGLFGLFQGLKTGIAAVFSAFAGWWLGTHSQGWQTLFGMAALLGIIPLAAIASIKIPQGAEAVPMKVKGWMLDPLKDAYHLLKRRPDYLRFELAFMVYGFAYMMTTPVLPIFLVDDLQLSYEQIGLTKGTIMQVVMILGILFFGRRFDRSTPHRMSAYSFLAMTAYPLLLVAAKYAHGHLQMALVTAAFVVIGISMSVITITWNLASLRFTMPGEDAGHYQSVHIAAVGIRAMFAPLLGFFVMSSLGREAALVVSSIVWGLSAGAMIWARRLDYRRGEATILRVG